MGIKDKVLDILFDDNDDREKEYHEDFSKPKKKTIVQKTLSDTGSIFIDATSPLPKAKQTNRQVQEEPAPEVKMVNDTGYQMSENISPIFGPIDSKNKKSTTETANAIILFIFIKLKTPLNLKLFLNNTKRT